MKTVLSLRPSIPRALLALLKLFMFILFSLKGFCDGILDSPHFFVSKVYQGTIGAVCLGNMYSSRQPCGVCHCFVCVAF